MSLSFEFIVPGALGNPPHQQADRIAVTFDTPESNNANAIEPCFHLAV